MEEDYPDWLGKPARFADAIVWLLVALAVAAGLCVALATGVPDLGICE